MSMSACFAFSASALLLVVAAVITLTGGSPELRATTSYARVDCAKPPQPSSAANSSAFRQNLLPLLAALPAAAAPTGFAFLHFGGAFVRGLCLGDTASNDCHACLAGAAGNLTGCSVGESRRAGVWRSKGCFVAYADANTSSAREDAFRDVVFTGGDPVACPNCFYPWMLFALAQYMARRGATNGSGAQVAMDATALARSGATADNAVCGCPGLITGMNTVRALAQCAPDRAAECARCLVDAARQLPLCSWGFDGAHARVADVLGYSCFLRIETSVPPVPSVTTSHGKPFVQGALFALIINVAARGAFLFPHLHLRVQGLATALALSSSWVINHVLID